jgi:outer membrane protein
MKYRWIIVFVLLFTRISAQTGVNDTLRLPDAVAIALDKNYSITLAQNNVDIARINNTAGNAGMLPKLDLTGTRSRAQNNSHMEYFDGRTRDGKNAVTNTINAGVQLTWTFFDGFNMFIQKNKLNQLENLSTVQLQSVVENTVSQVIRVYYEIAAQQQLADVYREAVKISRERLVFSKARFDLGSGSELGILQATVDMSTDSANYIKQHMVVENLKADMNMLLCRDLNTKFIVEKVIPVRSDLIFGDINTRMENENPELMVARNSIDLAALSVKELKSVQYPRLSLSSAYSYSRQKAEIGIYNLNRNLGFTVGVSLSYNLFNGFTNRQKINVARIKEESAKTEMESLKLELQSSLLQVFNDYNTNLQLVKFETENLGLARRNFLVAEERFRLGAITDTDLREIQKKLMDAENRLLMAMYRCKSAEIELMRLSGQLSKN